MTTTMMANQQEIRLPEKSVLDLKLAKTKAMLLTHKGAGFLGSLLCSHDIHFSYVNNTAWCNGTQIGMNPYFYMKLAPGPRVTLLAHELWHTGFDHMSRLDGRDLEIYNCAADFIINNMLDDHGFDFTNMHPLLDHQYDNMTTEQVYDLLIDDADFQPPSSYVPDICSGEGPADEQGEIPASALGSDIMAPLEGKSTDIKKSIARAVQVSKMSNEAGIIPGEIVLVLENFLSPALPWEVLLERYFTELSDDDYSWSRPSRRYENEYLPSMTGSNGLDHLIYYLDVSGSVSDEEILRFNSEVKHIHETYAPKRLTLVTFDTKLQDIYEFTEEDAFEKIVVHGRGGTDLECVRQHIKENKPTAAVVFSDLYCYPIEEDPGVPVLWIILDNKSAVTHFGRRIHMERSQI
jgi:predicted metal-dependent peptidase